MRSSAALLRPRCRPVAPRGCLPAILLVAFGDDSAAALVDPSSASVGISTAKASRKGAARQRTLQPQPEIQPDAAVHPCETNSASISHPFIGELTKNSEFLRVELLMSAQNAARAGPRRYGR